MHQASDINRKACTILSHEDMLGRCIADTLQQATWRLQARVGPAGIAELPGLPWDVENYILMHHCLAKAEELHRTRPLSGFNVRLLDDYRRLSGNFVTFLHRSDIFELLYLILMAAVELVDIGATLEHQVTEWFDMWVLLDWVLAAMTIWETDSQKLLPWHPMRYTPARDAHLSVRPLTADPATPPISTLHHYVTDLARQPVLACPHHCHRHISIYCTTCHMEACGMLECDCGLMMSKPYLARFQLHAPPLLQPLQETPLAQTIAFWVTPLAMRRAYLLDFQTRLTQARLQAHHHLLLTMMARDLTDDTGPVAAGHLSRHFLGATRLTLLQFTTGVLSELLALRAEIPKLSENLAVGGRLSLPRMLSGRGLLQEEDYSEANTISINASTLLGPTGLYLPLLATRLH